MELIDQKAKKIMEECRVRAEAAGLRIQGETLEYIITNQEMLELSPKVMIPTLYDYWVDDIEVLRGKWMYDVYPHNPYEVTLNTRPAISFYNDNNPDWLNAMIFYHVLGHIDMDYNNVFFRTTWDDDFCGQALADKRLVNRIREELGSEKRWVDYVIEFARGIDNLVGYYAELDEWDRRASQDIFGIFSAKANFYFGDFLTQHTRDKIVEPKFYYDELERYNRCQREHGSVRAEAVFFDDLGFRSRFPEFNSAFKKRMEEVRNPKPKDILQHLMDSSEFIAKNQNVWMRDILGVVRRTSLYFQPQIRTKICHEGWASYWHEMLFVTDPRIEGHEVDFARVNSAVLANPRLGLNPYTIGKYLFEFIEDLAAKGKLSHAYQLLQDSEQRKRYNRGLGEEYGKAILFEARRNLNDAMLVNFLSDEDFQDFVTKYNLFVAGMRFNPQKGVIEVYIKSRSGKDYREMLNKALYHPPYILISQGKAEDGELYLDHVFEGRMLVTEYIPAVLRGLAYLVGTRVKLETTEFEIATPMIDVKWYGQYYQMPDPEGVPEVKRVRVLYTCDKKNIQKTILS